MSGDTQEKVADIVSKTLAERFSDIALGAALFGRRPKQFLGRRQAEGSRVLDPVEAW